MDFLTLIIFAFFIALWIHSRYKNNVFLVLAIATLVLAFLERQQKKKEAYSSNGQCV